MTRIVLGLEGTVDDAPAVEWLASFAARLGAHVVVVHAVPRTTLWMISSVQADSDAYFEELRVRLDREVMATFREAGVSAALHLTRGDAAHELVRVAHRTGADFIVIGNADHGAVHDLLMGGMERRLEHLSEVPVIVVPTRPARASDVVAGS